MRVARREQDAVGKQRHPVLGDHRLAQRGGAQLARKHRHERSRQMLGDEDRNADPLGQHVEQDAERVDSAGRSADREHVDRVGRHCTKQRAGRSTEPARSPRDRGCWAKPSALSLASRTSEKRPLNRPVPGLGRVSAAPSASAATVSSAPSSASEDTIMTLAPPAASRIRGIELRPPRPGISRSSRTMST